MNTQKVVIRLGVLFIAMLIIACEGFAKIPEPDNIIYGLARDDATTTTLVVNGVVIATYEQGSDPDADSYGYYILRVPIDSFNPQEPGTARPGDTGDIYINNETVPEGTVVIGDRGAVQLVHFAAGDTDNDGIPDIVDDDDDGDGMPDVWEAANGFNPLLADGSGDGDNDGITNYQEYLNGSSPILKTPTLTSIVSDTGINNGVVNITDLVGTSFQDPATVTLTMLGEPDIVASSVVVNANTTQIVCEFDLTGVVPGAWDVEVTIPNGETGVLQSGFTVTEGAGGLLGNWEFEDGGGSVASDSSGNANHGTVNNGAAWNTTGAIGGALDFDGADDYVDVGDIDLTDSFTITAWVKLSGTGKSMIVGKTYQTYQFYVSQTGRLVFQRNSSTAISYKAGLTTGKWYHVAVTFNTTVGMVMYLNGSAVATDSDITPTVANNVATKIGAAGLTASKFFHGTLDEVRLYDVALTAQEVKDLFGNIGLMAHYAFEGSADDSSGNSNNGTVNGGAGWAAGENGNGLGLLCDGVDDYVDAGDINLTDSFTIAAWVKLSGTGKSMIVGKTYQSYQFYVSSAGNLVFQRNSSTAINYNAGLAVDTWYHIAVTFDTTGGMVMYLNGSSVATDGDVTPTVTNNVTTKIGAAGRTASNFFHGALDEVRLYDIALTARGVKNLADGLMAHYAFEGDADDSSINGNHGTVNGGAGWGAGENGNGLGLLCDGTDDYVDAGDIDLADSFTIAAWVKLSGTGKMMIVGKTYQTYQFYVSATGSLAFQRNSSTAINYHAGLTVDKWYHVAVTFNTTDGMVMYVNGSAVATDGDVTPTVTNNVATKIGAAGWTASNFFHGTLDEVRMYDTALTAQGVQGLVGNISFAAHYAFEGNADDSSGSGNHGTVYGGAGWGTGENGNGLGLLCDGTDDYVDAGDIDLADSFTIAAWIKLAGAGKYMIVGKSYQSYQFYVTASGGLVLQRNSSTAINHSAGLTTGTWYHVAVTFNTTDGTVMYLNGSAVATDGDTTSTNTNNVTTKIGAAGWSASKFFNGTLDEVHIRDTSLTDLEVFDLSNN